VTTCSRPCTTSYKNCVRASTCAYHASVSLLNFDDHLLLFDEGVQQGDPLGPLLSCVSSLRLTRNMFNLRYLGDDSVGGNVDSLLHHLETVKRVGLTIGLELKEDK
jgi:hypothetical protein